jgi:uncharacterized membrane protein YcaP (DUF421 family)
MEFMNAWWGINENITPLEIAARSAVMFVVALLLIRLSGMRPFGKGENFDKIITFLIGAILSRGVVGATPFFSTIISMIVILLIHRILSAASLYSKWFGEKVKGKHIILYMNGGFVMENLQNTRITHEDIMEELRMQCQTETLETIDKVFIERTGQISFVKKEG